MKKTFALALVILLGALAALAYAQDQSAPKAQPEKNADARTMPRRRSEHQ